VSWDDFIKFIKDNAVAIVALFVAAWNTARTVSLQKQMRDLQKNSSELAGVQLEQISEGKLKTTLVVTYERGDNRRVTFKIINKGVFVARDIKVKIDTSGSKFSHIDTKDFLTKDLTLFQ
jgi:hypothetical protein